jgi:hypothetical protein
MKHIKTWHSLNALFEGFESNDYYTEIDFNTYRDIKYSSKHEINKDCSLTEKEKDWIKSNIRFVDWKWCDDPRYTFGAVFNIPKFYSYSSIEVKSIYKIEDEYFLCRLKSKGTNSGTEKIIKYYKCDQFDGLKKLLKDKRII